MRGSICKIYIAFSRFYHTGNVSKTLIIVSKIKFHENPAAAVAVVHADGQADTKKSAVAFCDALRKRLKWAKIESE